MKHSLFGKIMTLAIMAMTATGCATISEANTAGYYRVWQGFKQESLDQKSFMGELPAFMKDTVDLYGGAEALNQYLVVIPPKNKPDFVPDELALVAITSEQKYQSIRATPEGRKYSERHWDVFNKDRSKSAKSMIDYFAEKPARLEPTVAYRMFDSTIDWSQGYSLIYIGTRKKDVSPENFLTRLQAHIELAAKTMGPLGLNGYLVTAHENYEVAYLHWDSQKAHDQAVSSASGKGIFADAGTFMDTLMYEPAFDLIAGEGIDHGRFYKTHRLQKKALIVVTSHDQLGTTGENTGYYFPEVAHPYFELSKAGIQVDIASPKGGPAPVDQKSVVLTDPVNKRLHSDVNFMDKLARTKALSEVDQSKYAAVIFAGGHGTMWDFKDSRDVQKVTADVYERGGVVAAVCHGPAALVDVKLSNGKYLIAGKNLTGFSNEEEEAVQLIQIMPFLLEDALKAHGGKFQQADLWRENVVVDGQLVTGQNPASAAGVGSAVARKLQNKF